MCEEEMHWTEQEFGSGAFGDERLTARLCRVARDLSENPEAAINQASLDWKSTKAAYRFFSNGRVTPVKILAPHREQTLARIKERNSVVLAIQDTTYLNFNGHKTCEGLGYIGTEHLKGIIAHTTLACSTDGLPLGILEQKLYTRDEVKSENAAAAHPPIDTLPIGMKESVRWIQSLQMIATLQQQQGAISNKIVTVCDREGDMAELLITAEQLGFGYVIRSSAPRKVHCSDNKNLHQTVRSAPIMGTIAIHIPSREGRKAITVTASVQFATVRLASTNGKIKDLTASIIRVAGGHGQNRLEWYLLTNFALNTFEEAVEKISWYKLRWHIEIFHKILKSGCQIESRRLGEVKRLYSCITLYSIIAWRLFYLTHLNRIVPTLSAAIIFTASEINALNALLAKRKKQLSVITVADAVLAIAILGVYLHRKNDPPPGPTILWRGWSVLHNAVEAIEASNQNTCG